MFKINPSPVFAVQVPLSVPGLPEPIDVCVTFRHKNKTALARWIADAQGKEHTVFLHEVIESWSGVQDSDGCDVPYSLSALTDLLGNYSIAHSELFGAYVRELTEAKRKNS